MPVYNDLDSDNVRFEDVTGQVDYNSHTDAVLAVTVAGLNQLGAPFFVEPIFDGAMLILAVGLAVIAAKRRVKLGAGDPEVPATAPATHQTSR